MSSREYCGGGHGDKKELQAYEILTKREKQLQDKTPEQNAECESSDKRVTTDRQESDRPLAYENQ